MNTGQVLQDRYELGSYRASNSVVELYDAVDRQLGRDVTIQIVHPALAGDAELARAFDAKQKVGLSLYHCSVLAIYDVGSAAGRAFSVMQRFRPLVPADYRMSDNTPEIATVLKITRQVAEALQCCRESGVADWTFAPEAVGLDDEGNVRLAILQGPIGSANSTENDIASLGQFLRWLLAGDAKLDVLSLPLPVAVLLERIEGRSGKAVTSLDELISDIEAIEEAGSEPTQTYVPDMGGIGGTRDLFDAPTLVAPVVAAPVVEAGYMPVADTSPQLYEPTYGGPVDYAVESGAGTRRSGRPVLLWGVGLLALILALFVVLPRLVDSQGALATGGIETASTPTSSAIATPVPLVAAPDLKGKSLDEARALAEGFRLVLVTGGSGSDKSFPPNTVLAQEPPVGTIVFSGSAITVSLNILTVTEPAVRPAAEPPAAEPPQPPAAPKGNEKKNNEPKGNEKAKDTGKEKDH